MLFPPSVLRNLEISQRKKWLETTMKDWKCSVTQAPLREVTWLAVEVACVTIATPSSSGQLTDGGGRALRWI